jgi:hypothetical protein
VFLALALVAAAPARAAEFRIPVFIAPSAQAGDVALAKWALAAWRRLLGDTVTFVPAAEPSALVRLYWTGDGRRGGFGETTPIDAGGRRGMAVHVNTEMQLLGPVIARRARADRLYRDTIVYLTCVHELGHALGLEHTADFADVMYSFHYGGDIPEYFDRYRRRLKTRADIARNDAFSDGDRAQARQIQVGRP